MMTLWQRNKETKGSKKCLPLLSFITFLSVLSVFAVENISAVEDPYEALRVVKPKTVKPAPLFTLKGLDGEKINLQDYKGKTVLLNFWATWCVPCKEEMPAMQKLYNAFEEKGFVILAVSLDKGERMEVISFVNEHSLTFPVLLDPGQRARKKYFVTALPTSYLIGPEKKLKGFISGARDWDSDDAFKLINTLILENKN